MSLIKFLLHRNKNTSILAAEQYGKNKSVKPKEISVLAYRQYGKKTNQNQHKNNEEELLKN